MDTELPSNIIAFSAHHPEELADLDFSNMRIINQATYLLSALKDGQKLTALNYLPRKIVIDFWEKYLKSEFDFKPYREADCKDLERLHSLLADTGYLRLKGSTLFPSEKAKNIRSHTLYGDLFFAMIEQFNWGYHDRYGDFFGYYIEDFEVFQEEAINILMWLVENRVTATSPDQLMAELFDYTIDPAAPKEDERHFILEEPIRCFKTRFFDRFCVPFGLMTSTNSDLVSGEISDQYHCTTLLHDQLKSILQRPSQN